MVVTSSRFFQLATEKDFFLFEASSHFWQTAQTNQIISDSCHESPNISHYPHEDGKMEQKLCMSISWQGCHKHGILSKGNQTILEWFFNKVSYLKLLRKIKKKRIYFVWFQYAAK